MANTTNYGWETPDDTDLVKDGAAAIRTLGSSIDTTIKALNPSTTLGDLEYRSATANTNTRLAIGTTGQILTVSGGVPVWAAPAGGGKVLQVVQATYGTQTESTSTAWADTGLSASITPSSTSSKILAIINQPYELFRSGTSTAGGIRLMRGSTAIWGDESASSPDALYTSSGGATSRQVYNYLSLSYLDSPSTTSATTYKTQFAVYDTSNSGRMRVQINSRDASIILLEIGA